MQISKNKRVNNKKKNISDLKACQLIHFGPESLGLLYKGIHYLTATDNN
jgi:hypothetical protein